MIDLVIFGTGGHAREMCELVASINQDKPTYNFLGFLDQAVSTSSEFKGEVLGNHMWLLDNPSVRVVVGIGSPVSRRRVAKLIRSVTDNKFETLIHPSAYIGSDCKIGQGSMVCAGVVITCGVSLGEHVIVNIHSSLSHETKLDDYVTIAPNVTICGGVVIAEGADIGASATIIQLKKIGSWSVVGAGAVVIKNIEDNVTVVGVPARTVTERQVGWQDINF